MASEEKRPSATEKELNGWRKVTLPPNYCGTAYTKEGEELPPQAYMPPSTPMPSCDFTPPRRPAPCDSPQGAEAFSEGRAPARQKSQASASGMSGKAGSPTEPVGRFAAKPQTQPPANLHGSGLSAMAQAYFTKEPDPDFVEKAMQARERPANFPTPPISATSVSVPASAPAAAPVEPEKPSQSVSALQKMLSGHGIGTEELLLCALLLLLSAEGAEEQTLLALGALLLLL